MQWITRILRGKQQRVAASVAPSRSELDRRAVEAAKRAVRDYRGVFERLAEYDRT